VRTILELFEPVLRERRTSRQIETDARQQSEDAQRHLRHHLSWRLALDTGDRIFIDEAEIEHRSAAGGVAGAAAPCHVVCGDTRTGQRMHDLGARAGERPTISDVDEGW